MKDLPLSPAQKVHQLRVADKRGAKVPEQWRVYIEIVLGGVAYRTKEKTIRFLQQRGLIKDSSVEQVIRSSAFEVTTRRQDLKLALVTPKELGLSDGGSLKDIYKEAKSYDLALLPADAGPQTMLQVRSSWTSHASIVVASEPITLRDGNKVLFDVSSFRLRVLAGEPGHHWEPTQPFLFRRL